MANDPLNLDTSAEWSGFWWLPDDPEHQVPGVLRYEPKDGLVLSLIGTFEDRIMCYVPVGCERDLPGHHQIRR